MKYSCFFDGATNPNPGQIGLGVAVFDENGIEVLSASGPGGMGTNNEGEYKALIWAMQLMLDAGIKQVHFFGDSKLVVNQVMGFWEVKTQGLRNLHHKAQGLGQEFKFCKLEWISRTENGRADALSKAGAALKTPRIVSALKDTAPAPEHAPSELHQEGILCEGAPENPQPAAAVSSTNNRVKVKGLAGNKIAFIYCSDVVVLDVNARHCSCKTFAAHQTCDHIKAVFNRLQAG